MPEKLINMIKCLYQGFQCAVLHEGKYSSFFPGGDRGEARVLVIRPLVCDCH